MNGELFQEYLRYSDAVRSFAMDDGWIMITNWTSKITNIAVNSEGGVVRVMCGGCEDLTLNELLDSSTNAEGILMRTHLKTYFKEIV
jgi:hypothetical protein